MKLVLFTEDKEKPRCFSIGIPREYDEEGLIVLEKLIKDLNRDFPDMHHSVLDFHQLELALFRKIGDRDKAHRRAIEAFY